METFGLVFSLRLPDARLGYGHEQESWYATKSLVLLTPRVEGTLSILLEYLPDSDLYGLLNSKEVLTWETRLHVAKDIAQGMVYKFHGGNLQPQKFIHESGFVHHDLKSLNVLVNKDEALIKAKIADLGEATMIFAGTKREQVDNPSKS